MPEPALLARSPVVTRSQEIAGYDVRMIGAAAGDRELPALLGACADSGSFFSRLPNRFALIDPAQIDVAKLAPQEANRLILEIDPAAQAVDALLPLAKSCKAAGFGICVQRPYAANVPQDVLEIANFFSLDCNELDGRLKKVSTQLRRHGAKQIAVQVDTPQTFDVSHRAGCDLFRGYHFTKPVAQQQSQAVNPTYATIVTLMQLAQQNAPVGKIEEALKRDAALSFKLLRYINSAGFGLSCEIQSFRHAVAVLGYQNLYRWLALLMVTAARQSTAAALLTTAITRGRLAELIGEDLFDSQERDNLFIVGAFSLLGVILKAPLQSIVEQIPLSETILDALFRHEGPYGPVLSIVEASESFDQPQVRTKALEMAGLLGLTAQHLSRAQL